MKISNLNAAIMSLYICKIAADMNWDDTQYLLALAREQSLRKAAKKLFVDQATVSRRIAVLENSLCCKLFIRNNKGYELTNIGQRALSEAIKMEQAALNLIDKVQGLDHQLKGEVVISTTDSIAIDFIIPAIKSIQERAPDIHIKLDVNTELRNMNNHNIDIAIRNIRPISPDLITRKLLISPYRLYASIDYINQHNLSDTIVTMENLDLIVYAPMVAISKTSLMGLSIEKARIALLTESSLLLRQTIKNGIGIGFLPKYMAEIDNLINLDIKNNIDKMYEIWMVSHQDAIKTSRVKFVMDVIYKMFKQY